MGKPIQGTSLPGDSTEARLESWKEIATYLNRDVTTVQRWEKREGMPVHRHVHDKRGSVYAFRRELDIWARSRNLEASGANESSAPAVVDSPRSRVASFRKWGIAGLLVAAVIVAGSIFWIQRSESSWRNPIAGARFQRVTDFDGVTQSAALSRDGQLLAFLSDRDGQMDVWITQVGSAEFHNLTRGSEPGLVNPSIRALQFSPDGSLVTFWVRKQDAGPNGRDISIWAVPTLGGQPRPYMEGAAELDWARDGSSRVAYHTTEPGDPLFVSSGTGKAEDRPIFTAPAGLHCHFPLWAPDSSFVYFAEGALPDGMNIWRIRPNGGDAEQMTSQGGVSYPVLLNRRLLMYLATDAEGEGPWLYSMDVEHRVPHQVSFGPDQYTSLTAGGDGRRLALTLAKSRTTLWRMRLEDGKKKAPPAEIALSTSGGRSPRLGPEYIVYVSSSGADDTVRKIADGTDRELWRGSRSQIIGAPAVSRDGHSIAFSVVQDGEKQLYVMESDGSDAKIIARSLDLEGSPAWSDEDKWITSAANDHGVPHLYRVPAAGGTATPFSRDYALDPEWSVDDSFVIYSGRDVGTTFGLSAITPEGAKHDLPNLSLTRGARHVVLLRDGHSLVVLRGDMQHKNLSLVDLQTGTERELTNLPGDFDIRDFDVSSDGRDVVLERVQERSDVVLLDLARP